MTKIVIVVPSLLLQATIYTLYLLSQSALYVKNCKRREIFCVRNTLYIRSQTPNHIRTTWYYISLLCNIIKRLSINPALASSSGSSDKAHTDCAHVFAHTHCVIFQFIPSCILYGLSGSYVGIKISRRLHIAIAKEKFDFFSKTHHHFHCLVLIIEQHLLLESL